MAHVQEEQESSRTMATIANAELTLTTRRPQDHASTEVIFGTADERHHLRHEAGSGAGPYFGSTLLAIRKVNQRVGLTRALDGLLFDK
jgi:4-hydroxy-tetrahydrodipicolinate reductase